MTSVRIRIEQMRFVQFLEAGAWLFAKEEASEVFGTRLKLATVMERSMHSRREIDQSILVIGFREPICVCC